MRVAIVGQGPKGLFALGELVARWPDGAPLDVHCLDPREPGVGAAYDPSQPDFLRLNVTPQVLRMAPLPDFVDWLAERGVGADGDVPRALVGRYLEEARNALLASLPEQVRVVTHRAAASSVEEASDGWRVVFEDERGATEVVVDEVLLATGHTDEHDSRLVRQWDPGQSTRLVERVYPVQQWLDEQHVPPGCTVAVRGASLTFIDVALALTEGRERSRWPARILPLGRGGALMAAKPPARHRLGEAQQRLLDECAATMPTHPLAVLNLVRCAAVELLVMEGKPRGRAAQAVETALATGWDQDLQHAPRALAALERSLAIGGGLEAPSASWMLGRAWAALYPSLVGALSLRSHDPQAWQGFAKAAATLEKFTYGPLRPNAWRLASLCRQGVVDLTWLEHGVRVGAGFENLPDGESAPDVVIDAVNSPPGAAEARNPVIDALLAAGLVHIPAPLRGLDITASAQCVAADGSLTRGLSALGRPVEDVVIGNDTLGRALHQQVEGWARRLASTTTNQNPLAPQENR